MVDHAGTGGPSLIAGGTSTRDHGRGPISKERGEDGGLARGREAHGMHFSHNARLERNLPRTTNE